MFAELPERQTLKLETANLEPFLNALAAKQPTPGGGSASALGGAIGVALGSMAANYTVDNEKYDEFDAAARAALGALEALRGEFLVLMEQDIAAYDSYRAALTLPKGTPDEKNARSKALAAAREQSTVVPEHILRAAQQGLETVLALSAACNPNLAGDVASSAYFLEACARAAAIQIVSNCAAADSDGANARRRGQAANSVALCQTLREKIHSGVSLLILPISKN